VRRYHLNPQIESQESKDKQDYKYNDWVKEILNGINHVVEDLFRQPKSVKERDHPAWRNRETDFTEKNIYIIQKYIINLTL
jgi:hypothetical protein